MSERDKRDASETTGLLLVSTAGLIRTLAGTGYAESMRRMTIPSPGHEAAPRAPYAGIILWRVSEDRMRDVAESETAVMYVTKRGYRHWRRLSLASLALAASIACSRTTEPAWFDGFWSANDVWSGQIILTPNSDDPHWPSDPVTIHAAEVKGDSLELTVSFGGGCRNHAFALLADAAWMESYPVQIGVRLAHDARDDACKALLSRVLRFDLAPLKAAYAASYQAASGIIRLNVRGAPASPTYSW